MQQWLKDWRDSNSMTQEEAAIFLQIPKTTYASYEQGKRLPSVERAKKLAGQMHVKWTYFFEK